MLRVFGHYCSASQVALFAAEAAALLLALGLGLPLLGRGGAPVLPGALAAAALTAVTFQLCLYLGDLYDVRIAGRDRGEGVRLLRWLGVAAIALGLASWLRPGVLPPSTVLGAASFAMGSVLLVRWGLPGLLGRRRRVVIFGTGPRAVAAARAIDQDASGEAQLMGFVGPAGAAAPGPLCLCEEVSLDRLAASHGANLWVVAYEDRRGALRSEELLRCRLAGTEVVEVAHFSERILRRLPLADLRPSYLLFSDGWSRGPVHRLAKRTFDLLAAGTLVLLGAPVMLAVALLVRLTSKGPILFRQERVGQWGRPYTLVKFRTMREDAEARTGPVWAEERDPRVTPIGALLRKARLDELPQIFNVLSGSMSFVGPRPERAFFTERLQGQIPFFDLRLAVKPGITGWAQLRYPYGASVEDARAKLEFDLYYVKNASVFLDALIVFHTVKHVLFGRGAR